jgi:tetratricopeptide (TPR) repeat protein
MTEPAVDPAQPWLGLHSFSESTRGFFYGREDEIAELARRVQRKLLTVLFGQSGLGKTSILRAGLVPRLRPAGYCPVYVRLDYGRDSPSPAAQIKQAVFRETLASGTWTQTGAAVENESLWEFLHHRDDVLRDADGRTLTPLLIFDQFEEIFTLAQGNDFGRARAAEFVRELADLAENRPPAALEARLDSDDTVVERFDFARGDYRILIALREDYLAHLESLKAAMPSITQNRMRLARMTGEQALDAVVKPGGALVSQEVADAIVRFVAGGAELRNAEVEPSLLSLICRELNAARIAQGKAEISAYLLAGSHATILAEFYERALADQPAGVHRFIEDQLLTESGFRENIAQERVLKAFADAGAAPGALATLVDRRLLRVEERLDVRRVELTHDVLCGVVAAARQARQEREARELAEAALATQREREAATRRALVRARQIAGACILLAIGAAGAAAFGIYGMHQAQKTHAVAEAARSESERLIVYLLDDFYRELEPVGRLEIVGELARRSLAYYDGLPGALRSDDTRRNQALAQARYGIVLRNQGRADEARKVLEPSIATLEALRGQGDMSEATAIGLAMALSGQARLLSDATRPEALAPAQRAVEVLKDAAAAPDVSISVRRAQAAALTQLGFLQLRTQRNAEALVTLRAAVEAYRGVDGLRSDNDAAANYVITSAWLMDALTAAGRSDEALRVGEEARKVATTVLDRQPTHMIALRGRALVASNNTTAYAGLLQRGRQLESADAAAADWLTLASVDPSNVITAANLGVSRINGAGALSDLGRPREAAEKYLQSSEIEVAVAAKSPLARVNLGFQTFLAATANAERGELAQAERQYADATRILEAWAQGFAAGSYERRFWSRTFAIAQVEFAVARGDLAAAQRAAKGAREALLEVDPGGEPGRRQTWASMLRRLHAGMVRVEIESNDLAAAAQQAQWVASARRDLPALTMDARREQANDEAMSALVLARLGRVDEARPLAAKVLAFQREVNALGTDDQMHKVDLALALVVSAWVDPSQATPLLGEARTALGSLPAEARALRTTRWVDGLIDQAARRGH